MAAVDVSGFNGGVTLPSTHGGAAKAFTVNMAMATKDTSRYTGTKFSQVRGGTITISGTISVFLRMGAASSTPNFVNPAPDGAALTLTLEVGCTLSGTAVMTGISVNHAFGDPAIEGTYNFQFTGTVTEAWAST